jgi:hypothetical protein
LAAGAILQTASGGTALLSGGVENMGTLFASGAGSLIDIANGATVAGGVAEVGNGIVDIQASGNDENVAFQSGGSGGLELADATAYGGTVSGFGQNVHQYIDLTSVKSNASVSLSYSSSTSSSGVLMVSSGSVAVADIAMSGTFTTASFHLGAGVGGSVKIIDPPPVVNANVALFVQYIAASFASPGAEAGMLIATAPAAGSTALLATPHAPHGAIAHSQ